MLYSLHMYIFEHYLQKYRDIQKALNTLKDHSDPDIKKTAMGAYFVLYEKDKIVHDYEPKPGMYSLTCFKRPFIQVTWKSL